MPPRIAHGPLTAAQLEEWYAVTDEPTDRRWVRASFISSLDGRVAGPDGLSGSLNAGSAADEHAFAQLRAWADVVVVGAGTVRQEGYRPLSATPMLIVSRSGDVPASAHEPEDGAGATGEVLVLGGDGESVRPGQVVDVCAEQGWRRVVLEGGPTLLGDWLTSGLVDELCLTLRPVLQGGDGPLLVPPGTQLRGLVGSASHVLHWGEDVLLRVRLR